jgi:hypothetical protein
VKTITLILGISVIAFLTAGGIWLYAQQERHPAVSLPPKQAPVAVQTSTIAQAVVSNTSTPPTLAAPSTTPTVGTPGATPSMVIANTSTPVTVTVQITGPNLIPGSVNLLLLGATGTQPTILGVMQDGSGVYSLQSVFDETTTGDIKLEVSAAFQGLLKRVISPVLQIPVWGVVADTISGFKTLYPPSLYDLSSTTVSEGLFLLQSSPDGVDIGGEGPEDGSNATTSGFSIVIQPSQYSTAFDINSWLSTEYEGSDIASLATTTIGGVPGYVFTFADEIGAGEPTAVAYHNGYVYQIAYSSTFALGSTADANGLSAFNAVLQNFTFLN